MNTVPPSGSPSSTPNTPPKRVPFQTASEAVRQRAKELAAQTAAEVLTNIPQFGLSALVRKVKRDLLKNYEKNPNNDDPRVIKLQTEFGLKMSDVFLLSNKRLSRRVRRKMFGNVFNNAIVKGKVKRAEFLAEHGWLPPGTIVFNPTMRCNLACTGCYAFEYNKTKSGDLSYEIMDRIVREGKELGVYFFVITGGEPMIRKDDLFRLWKEHSDCYFIMYTNGTLITDEVAKQLEKVANVAPCISVEGYQQDTDKRRGAGVHDKIMAAMAALKKYQVPFAISVTVTRNNQPTISTREFLEYYIDQGALFAWYFQYMPVGRKPNMDLVPTAEQRQRQRRWTYAMRRTKLPIVIADFWSDGPLVGGCLAAGIGYLNITGDGNIQPCVFTHFHVDNIKDTTLVEALQSPFFTKYREAQKTVTDRYRPCGIIDHVEHLRKAVKEGGGKPSYQGADDIVSDPEIVKKVDVYTKEVDRIIGESWRRGEE